MSDPREPDDLINNRTGDRANSDNNFAVIADRLARLMDDFSDHRKEVKEDIKEVKEDMKHQAQVFEAEMIIQATSMADMKQTLDMAKGGYYALAAIGAVIVFLSGYVGKFLALFH